MPSLTSQLKAPWQIWVRADGRLTLPHGTTREDLYWLADLILESAARAGSYPDRNLSPLRKR